MARTFSPAAFLILLAACGTDHGTTAPDPQPATLAVAVGKPVIEMGTSTIAGAVVRDAGGTLLPGYPVSWSSSEPTVASIDAGGRITATTPGNTVIRAVTGGLADSVSLAVVAAAVPALQITLRVDSLLLMGYTIARVNAVNYPHQPPLLGPVTWASSNPAVATVNSAGQIYLIGPGDVTIAAEYAGIRGTFPIRVPTADSVVIISADRAKVNDTLEQYTRSYAAGKVIALQATWSVTDPTAGTFTSAGRLVASRTGPITVRATVGNATATHDLVAYDWVVTTDANGTTAMLPLQGGGPNAYEGFEYPNFTVSCVAGMLSARLNAPYAGPASVQVAIEPMYWDAAWVEQFTGGTNTLTYAAAMAYTVRGFLDELAYMNLAVFLYTPATGGAQTLDFRMTGLRELLDQEFAGCS